VCVCVCVCVCVQEGQVTKLYVARVWGVFPEGDIVNDTDLGWDPKTNYAFCVRGDLGNANSGAPPVPPRSLCLRRTPPCRG
jgi:hypothetical protein